MDFITEDWRTYVPHMIDQFDERYTEKHLPESYDILKKQLAEKDAMINWLAKKLVDNGILKDCGEVLVCEKADLETSRELNKRYQEYLWYKAAQDAVKKDV